MKDIKACPFCGNDEDFEFQTGTKDREGTPINVICCSCGATGPWVYGNETDALREWNMRF